MSYRKQIGYLELRENGQRIKSAGYARLESLDKESILKVQLTEIPAASGSLQLYLQIDPEEELFCEIQAMQGRAACEKKIPKAQREGEEISGIRIPLSGNREIVGRFAAARKVPTDKAPESKTLDNETGISEKIIAAQTTQTSEKSRENRTRQVEEAPKPAKEAGNTIHMQDTKWEQLSSIYPHIHPFRDAREFLSVGPEDFVILREKYYQMTHNSFLLHGYYNYRHLLLMRQETSGQVKYYIGVPGNFYEREKQVARMFGFESFEGTREPARDGDFGYYLIPAGL